MSLLSGSLTTTRFRVDGGEEDRPNWRDFLRERLIEFSFREPPQGMGRETVNGWCLIRNPLMTDFTDINQWLFGEWAVFSLRTDKKKIPTSLLKAKLEIACEEWCEEHGLSKCPASLKSELKEEVEDMLLSKQLPSIKTVEIAWDVSTGTVLVASHSDSVLEEIRKRFYRTFGLRLIPWSPLDWMTSAVREAVLMGSTLGPDASFGTWTFPTDSEGTPTPSTFAPEFYTWLWFYSEQNSALFEVGDPLGSLDVWVDERLSFRPIDVQKSTAVLTGENPSAELEARAALASGKVPSEIRIGLRREDRETICTLKGAGMDFHTMKIPQVVTPVTDGHDELILDRLFLHEDFAYALGALVRMFARVRTSNDWPEIETNMRSWWSE